MAGNKIRVMIVDDSVFYRKIIRESIAQMPNCEVVGTSIDGSDAIEMARKLRPDLITLDQEMPKMNGIDALAKLKKDLPESAVLMISSLTSSGAQITTKALELGAFDFILKPKEGTLEQNVAHLAAQLRSKIEAYQESRYNKGFAPTCSIEQSPKSRVIRPTRPSDRAPTSSLLRQVKCGNRIQAILIGVSTGGPAALTQVIPNLMDDLPIPVFIVQHMPPMFTKSLADHLNSQSSLTVCEGRDLQMVLPGMVYIAPGGKQMKINSNGAQTVVRVTDDPADNAAKPSVDYLFRSAADVYGANCLAVVMTGMGSDGLAGARILRAKGATIFAQDQASSTVWGMPRAVAEDGQAHEVLPLKDIAPAINQAVQRSLAACN